MGGEGWEGMLNEWVVEACWRNLMRGTQAVKSPLCMLGGWILCVLHSGVKLIELLD